MKKVKSMNGKVVTKSRQQLYNEVQVEINENKVSIDKTVFAKTEEEKQQLKKARKNWNKEPQRDKNVIDSFTRSRMPNWNISVGVLPECI